MGKRGKAEFTTMDFNGSTFQNVDQGTAQKPNIAEHLNKGFEKLDDNITVRTGNNWLPSLEPKELSEELSIKAGYTSGRSGGTYYTSDDKKYQTDRAPIENQKLKRDISGYQRNADDLNFRANKAEAEAKLYKTGMEEARAAGAKLAKSNRRMKLGATIAAIPAIAIAGSKLGQREQEKIENKGYKELDDTIVTKSMTKAVLMGGAGGATIGAATGAAASKPGERLEGAKRGAIAGGATGAVGMPLGIHSANKNFDRRMRSMEKSKKIEDILRVGLGAPAHYANDISRNTQYVAAGTAGAGAAAGASTRLKKDTEEKGFQELDGEIVIKAFPGFENTVMAARQRAGGFLKGKKDYVPRRRGIEVDVDFSGKRPTAYDRALTEVDSVTDAKPTGKRPTAYDKPISVPGNIQRLSAMFKGVRGESKFKLGEQIKCSSGYKIKTKGIARGALVGAGAAIPAGVIGNAAGVTNENKKNMRAGGKAYAEEIMNHPVIREAREREQNTGKKTLLRLQASMPIRMGRSDSWQASSVPIEKGILPKTNAGIATAAAIPAVAGVGGYVAGKKKEGKNKASYEEAARQTARYHNEGKDAITTVGTGRYYMPAPKIEKIGDLPDDYPVGKGLDED